MCCLQAGVGIAFSPALEQLEAYLPLPGTATLEEARAAQQTAYGEMHASLACLLRGTAAGGGEEERRQLRASEQGLERVQAADPVFVQSMAALLRALRLFSCS